MKLKLSILTGALLALSLPLQTWAADTTPTDPKFGVKSTPKPITEVEVTNLTGQVLGRIQDVALDLTNGRILEVLVVYNQTLRFGGKTVAVPSEAFITDANNEVYKIDTSVANFKAAPAFDMDKWAASTQPDKVAAAYKYFGYTPNFLIPGEAPGRTAVKTGRPLKALGPLDQMTEIMNLNVDDMKNTRLGTIRNLVMDIPSGRILNVYVAVRDGGDARIASTVISPTMLRFNAKHDGLLLDVTKAEYDQQPDIIYDHSISGSQQSASVQQPATTAPTTVALVQGSKYRDINITAKIYEAIHERNLDANDRVEVGTQDGRVTLRGPVTSQATKDSIGAIAIDLVTVNNVDNQIILTSQAQASN